MKPFSVLIATLIGTAFAVPLDPTQSEQTAKVQETQAAEQRIRPLTEKFKDYLCRVLGPNVLCARAIAECESAATKKDISDHEEYLNEVEKCFDETKKPALLRSWYKGSDIENTAFRNAVDQCRDIVGNNYTRTEARQCIRTQNKKLLEESLSNLKTVWRGDLASPTEYRKFGGIPPEFSGPTTNLSYSLQVHHIGKGEVRSAYASTSYKFSAALFFATMDDQEDGWMYEIQTTPNMVDMAGSGINSSFREREFSCMGGIRMDQIRRFARVPKGNNIRGYSHWRQLETLEEIAELVPELEWKWTDNDQYNKEFERYTASRGQPQLVGPTEAGQPATEYMGKSLEEWAIDFMNHTGWPVGWNGSFPLDLTAAPDFSDTKLRAPVPVAPGSV